MKIIYIAISLLLLSGAAATMSCEAHGGGHGGGAAHIAPSHSTFYANGSAANPMSGPLPSGSNGYAYRPVGAGYFGRRWRGGGYAYGQGLNAAYNDSGYHPTYKPVDNSFDEWNRAELKHLRALPTSAFVKEYHWSPSAPQSNSQLAGKTGSLIH